MATAIAGPSLQPDVAEVLFSGSRTPLPTGGSQAEEPHLMISIAALALTVATAAQTPRSLSLLVWGDLAGDPSPKLFSWVDSLRREAEEKNQPLLALDAGNSIYGSDLSFVTKGLSQAKVLGLLEPDAITLGARDFWWDRKHLDTVLAKIKFPVVTTNLVWDLNDKPYGGKSFVMWDFGDLRVGLIGVADPELKSDERPSKAIDLRAKDAIENVQSAMAELKRQKVDVAVVLSHAGREIDLALAQAVEGIDLIVGSRSEAFSAPEQIGKTWIVRTASGPDKLTRVEWNAADSSATVTAALSPVPKNIRLPSAWRPVYDSLAGVLRARTEEVLATSKDAWSQSKRDGMLGNYLADALREEAGTNVAFWPASAIQNGIARGRVTVGDLWKILPSPEQVSVFEIPGSDLEKIILRQMQKPKDFLFLSGATCTSDSSRFGGSPIQVTVGGKPLQPSDRYKIAIPLAIRDDIYDLLGMSLESAAPVYLERWDRDMVENHARKNQFRSSTGRVPAMYGVVR
jgi:5'-nucleotidase / UDP-sugar diphosphatase